VTGDCFYNWYIRSILNERLNVISISLPLSLFQFYSFAENERGRYLNI